MKKTIITALALSLAMSGFARLVEVASISEVPVSGLVSEVATISPDGRFVVTGQMGGNTLTMVDLSSGTKKVITTNGNPNGVAISGDGQNVVFRATTVKDRLRYTSLEQVDLTSGKQTRLVNPTRHLNTGVAINGSSVTAVENGKVRAKALRGGKAQMAATASINYGHLDITVGGKTTTIDPQGRGSYLWPSISPDGTKVVYCLAGAGAFVCDLDGSNARQLGNMHAPKWLGNDKIVAMQDDAELTRSAIVVCDLNGTIETLTPADQVAIYPSATADGKVIAYSDTEGHLYTITLK